ncbi:hypothetical protein R1sor_010072 [Riccia sorocarpa]|uniref:Uncharacterized protein n=1 Tax=Riccia sorocarpa TaxID=122646 RepID=A0ABD3I109_9MARC
MAAITSKPVHELVQQLDRAAVSSNKDDHDDFENSDTSCHAALLLETLGIDNWVNLFHIFTTKGEEATLTAIRALHDELPAILENDLMEEGRSEKMSALIGKALSWVDLDKSLVLNSNGPNDDCKTDVPAQVRSNPLIDFGVFSEEEKAAYSDNLDNFNLTQVGEKVARTEKGDPFIPTDSLRTVEYKYFGNAQGHGSPVPRRNMAREFNN